MAMPVLRFIGLLHENGGWYPKLLDGDRFPETPQGRLIRNLCSDCLADRLQKGPELRHGEVIEFAPSF